MKSLSAVLLAFGLLLLASAPVAAAGIELQWDNCPPNGLLDVSLDCTNPDAVRSFYAAITSDVTIPEFVAADIFIDFHVDSPGLRDFWKFDTLISDGCNPGILLDDTFDPLVCSGLGNLWGDDPYGSKGDVALGYVPHYGGDPTGGRLVASIFRASIDPILLSAGQPYFLFRVALKSEYSSEAGGSCDGCCEAVAFTLKQVNLQGLDVRPILTTPGPAGNVVTVTPSGCVTPVQNKTWGQLKALYR